LERYHEYGEVGVISKSEITELLEAAGFKVENVYGNFDKTEYRTDSPRIAIVARKE